MESGKDVVLQIPNSMESFSPNKERKDPNPKAASPIRELGSNSFSLNSQFGSSPKNQNLDLIQVPQFGGFPSPSNEIGRNKPPKTPTEEKLTPRRSLSRSNFSKPKSRLVEPAYLNDVKKVEEKVPLVGNSSSPYRYSSPNNNVRPATTPVTPKTPLMSSPGGGDDDEDDEVYQTANLKVSKKPSKKWKFSVVVEWIVFLCVLVCLIASLTILKLQNFMIWGLELWKWCVLVMVIFCGRLITEWMMNVVVFLIERNFLLKKKVLYFVYGLRKSVQVFVWLGLILLAWGLLFSQGVKRTRKTTRTLSYITRALASCLTGAAIWLVKTLLVKILASSFQCTRFFDRIQESIFHQYILRVLSGPPLMEMSESVKSTNSGHLSFKNLEKNKKEGKKEEVIDVEKLKKMSQEKVSAWTMKGLMNVIHGSGLSTISNELEDVEDEENEQKDKEITSEWEAKAAAYRIFRNVAKPGRKYIEEEDLLRFMKKEEVDNVLVMFEGAAGTGKIKRSALKNWVVNVYNERKSLAHSLNDTKTAIEELNRLASGVVLIVDLIVLLLFMGLLTTQVLLFISSQLLLVAFMFGNSAKTVFEAIIFVFIMHPFDVGDRCVVDGVQMIVEEMNILTTIFLRYDNEKICYPNSVLATKPISNFYRSPEMSDSVEFAVDISTSVEQIGALKAKIKEYLESKPEHWRPGHGILVKEIEDVNKMKMGLYVTHTINFQNYGDKSSRRSELVMELKKTFEALAIKYHLLPQEVQISYVGSAPAATAFSPRAI